MLEKTTTSQSSAEPPDYKVRQDQQRAYELWSNSGVNKRHREGTIDELAKHEKWAARMQKAGQIIDNGGIVLFLGDRGNGKTQCAVEIIREQCRLLKSCMYVRSREIGMKLREAYGRGSDSALTELQAVGIFVKPHLLVIDECQERMDTDFEVRSFSLILDKRYADLLPTILIANCSQKTMTDIMGSSVCDRVKEDGGALMFDWPSFRQQKQGDSDAV